jgi:glutamate-1-semialdehyde 2,1-aminomutase
MTALRAARAITGKARIAKAEGAYHGSYDAVEYSLMPPLDKAGPATAPRAVPATPGLPPDAAAHTLVFPYNDTASTVSIIEANASELAAVLIDPCVSRMGFIMGDTNYLQAVRDACSRCGVVLIYDEIFSFRLHNRGAQAIAGVKPDLTTFGKVIGGGLPIGAVGGSKACMGVFDQLSAAYVVEHSGTHFANPLSLAAGKAAMQALDQDCTDHLARLGEQLREGINESFGRHGLKGHAAGSGSLVCAMLSEQPLANFRDFMQAMQAGAAAFGMLLHRALLNRGAHIVPGGGFILSSAMQASDVSALLAMIDEAMPEVKQAMAAA